MEYYSSITKNWRRKWQPTPVLLPGEFQGLRSLAGYSPWDHRVGHDCGTNCITKNGILPLVTACVDLEGIMLSEISQVEKDNVRSHLYVKSKKSRFAFSLSLVS